MMATWSEATSPPAPSWVKPSARWGRRVWAWELLVCWVSLQLWSGLKRSEKVECRWGHDKEKREREEETGRGQLAQGQGVPCDRGQGGLTSHSQLPLTICVTLGIISAPDQLIYLQEEARRLAVIPAPLLLRVTASSFLNGPAPTAATDQEWVGGCRWHGSAGRVGGVTPEGCSCPRSLQLSACYLLSPQDPGNNGMASSDAQTVLQQLLQVPPQCPAGSCEFRGKMSSLPSR